MLGGNWSNSVTVKENHTLILRGPYRIARHPIYSGILLGMLGSALQRGDTLFSRSSDLRVFVLAEEPG